MKALVASQHAVNVRAMHLNLKSATDPRRSEASRVSKPSVGSLATHENTGRRPVTTHQDDLARRKCRNQLVNSWIALQKRTAPSSRVKRDHTAISDMPAPPDVNGNRDGSGGGQTELNLTKTLGAPSLPVDPRLWSPSDVEAWVHHMALAHSLDVDRTFFQMNGRGLCLMTLKGFLFRVPDYGHLMYNDFRARLGRCLSVTTSSSSNGGDKGKVAGTETSSRMDNQCTATNPLDLSSSPLDLTCRKSPLTYHTL